MVGKIASIVAALLLFAASSPAANDPRCCVEHERWKDGGIKRSVKPLREFEQLYPCPAGASIDEPCSGWQIDHVIPLACGGRDDVGNLQWLPVEIKACAGTKCKDRFERAVYCK